MHFFPVIFKFCHRYLCCLTKSMCDTIKLILSSFNTCAWAYVPGCLKLGTFYTLVTYPFLKSLQTVLCLNFFASSCPISLNFSCSLSDDTMLTIPVIGITTYGDWICNYWAAKQCNSLPIHTCHLPFIKSFKHALKTHLVHKHYSLHRSTIVVIIVN